MTPPLFLVSDSHNIPDIGGSTLLGGDEGRHAVSVRRIKPGEVITLGDGAGTMAAAEVESLQGKDTLRARIVEKDFIPRPETLVTLVQALPKSDRSELAVELATEAGIDFIVPWQSERSVARWVNGAVSTQSDAVSDSPTFDGTTIRADEPYRGSDKARKGIIKWRKTALAAAKQSRRPWVPVISDLVGIAGVTDLVHRIRDMDGVSAVLHESATSSLTELSLPRVRNIVLIVGPEGGLSEGELAALDDAGACAVLLGPEVLRTSTAAAVALGAIGALTDRW